MNVVKEMEVSTVKTDQFLEYDGNLGLYDVIHRDVFIALGTVFAVIGFTGSVLLIAVCCIDAELRRSSKHFLIISICILCVLENCLGAFIVHTHVHNIDMLMVYGCDVLYFISAAGYISVSIIVLLVASVAFDTALSLCMNASTSPGVRICMAFEWVVLVVVGTLLMLLPLMGVDTNRQSCSVYMGEHYMLALNVIHVLPQVMVLILAGLVLVLVYRTKQGRRPDEDIPLPFPVDIYLASALAILLKLPDFIFSLGFNVCQDSRGQCSQMYVFWAVSTYSSTVLYVLLPYTWLAGKDTRDGLRRIFSCRTCCKPTYRQDSYILTSPDEV